MIANIIASFSETAPIYFIFTFASFFIFWLLGARYFAYRRIQQPQKSTIAHIGHDLGFSMSTLVVFALLDAWVLYMESKGYTLIYYDIDKYGWAWLLLSGFLVLFIDDTFFYWMHRLIHQPRFYKQFHAVHHHSNDPNPFTSYSFSLKEAVIQNAIYCIVPFIMPIHPSIMVFWVFFGITNNVTLHSGFEAYPKWWLKIPFLRYKTVCTHHNMHHEHFNGNYALYFTWWDKWMGTELPNYEQHFISLHERNNQRQHNTGDNHTTIGHNITAHIKGKTYHFSSYGNQSILQSAIDQNIPIDYSCQSGICGKCKLKCAAGQVDTQLQTIIPKSEAEQGFILACQSRVAGEKIILQKD